MDEIVDPALLASPYSDEALGRKDFPELVERNFLLHRITKIH